MPSAPVIAELYECSLNDGVSPDQVVALGQGDFAQFVADNDLTMNTYLWEAVAINAPYNAVSYTQLTLPTNREV